MKRITLLLVLCLVIVALSGCAPKVSKPSKYAIKGYTSDPKKSFARNVIKSGGLDDVKDVSSEEMNKVFNSKFQSDNLGSATFATLNFISDLNQLGLATLPLSFMSWNYVFGTKPDQRAYPKVYAWMPRDMANTPEEAKNVLEELLLEALKKALQEVDFPEPYVPVTEHLDAKQITPNWTETAYKIKGGVCDDENCQYGFAYLKENLEGIALPYPGISPDFQGVEDTWAFTRESIFRLSSSQYPNKNTKERAILPDTEVYKIMTKHLPSWIYVYLPNSQKSHLFFANGQPLPMPVVLNQGKIHLFVKPEKG